MAKDDRPCEPSEQEFSDPLRATLVRVAAMTPVVEETHRNVKELDRVVRGSNGNPGMLTRLSCVEGTVRGFVRVRRVLFTAIIGAIAVLCVGAAWKVTFSGEQERHAVEQTQAATP